MLQIFWGILFYRLDIDYFSIGTSTHASVFCLQPRLQPPFQLLLAIPVSHIALLEAGIRGRNPEMASIFTWSTWLYLAMSLCRVLSMIMATMPDRKRTMTSEFMILENTSVTPQHQQTGTKTNKSKKTHRHTYSKCRRTVSRNCSTYESTHKIPNVVCHHTWTTGCWCGAWIPGCNPIGRPIWWRCSPVKHTIYTSLQAIDPG